MDADDEVIDRRVEVNARSLVVGRPGVSLFIEINVKGMISAFKH